MTEEIDPLYHLLPEDQIDRVSGQDMCDIDREFLGFTEIYIALATIIPKHWTVVDLGCAYAAQSVLFKDHASYVGVDLYTKERFGFPNSVYYDMRISEFIDKHADDFDHSTTFAICSYVPDWHDKNRDIVRKTFLNVFTYYPAGSRQSPGRPDVSALLEKFK